jgi:hypothetical protein
MPVGLVAGPFLVVTTRLHGPSNDGAATDGMAAKAVIAKTVASVAARMELLRDTLVLIDKIS